MSNLNETGLSKEEKKHSNTHNTIRILEENQPTTCLTIPNSYNKTKQTVRADERTEKMNFEIMRNKSIQEKNLNYEMKYKNVYKKFLVAVIVVDVVVVVSVLSCFNFFFPLLYIGLFNCVALTK